MSAADTSVYGRPLTPPLYPSLDESHFTFDHPQAAGLPLMVESWEACQTRMKTFLTDDTSTTPLALGFRNQAGEMVTVTVEKLEQQELSRTTISSNKGVFPGWSAADAAYAEMEKIYPLYRSGGPGWSQVITLSCKYPVLHPQELGVTPSEISVNIEKKGRAEVLRLNGQQCQETPSRIKAMTLQSCINFTDKNSPLWKVHEEVDALERFTDIGKLSGSLKNEDDGVYKLVNGINVLVTNFELLEQKPRAIGEAVMKVGQHSSTVYKRLYTFTDYLWSVMKDIKSLDALRECWYLLYQCFIHKSFNKLLLNLPPQILACFEEIAAKSARVNSCNDLSEMVEDKDLLGALLQLGLTKLRADYCHIILSERRSNFKDLFQETFTNCPPSLDLVCVLQVLGEQAVLQVSVLPNHGELYEELVLLELSKVKSDKNVNWRDLANALANMKVEMGDFKYDKTDLLIHEDMTVSAWAGKLGPSSELVLRKATGHHVPYSDKLELFDDDHVMWKLSVEQAFIDVVAQPAICIKNVCI